jgi:hypothetical protein
MTRPAFFDVDPAEPLPEVIYSAALPVVSESNEEFEETWQLIRRFLPSAAVDIKDFIGKGYARCSYRLAQPTL